MDFSIDNFAGGSDISVEAITAPLPTGCDALSASETVTAVFRNHGSDTITNAMVDLLVNDTLVVTEILSFSLPPCFDTLYTFLTTANLSTIQNYQIKIVIPIFFSLT